MLACVLLGYALLANALLARTLLGCTLLMYALRGACCLHVHCSSSLLADANALLDAYCLFVLLPLLITTLGLNVWGEDGNVSKLWGAPQYIPHCLIPPAYGWPNLYVYSMFRLYPSYNDGEDGKWNKYGGRLAWDASAICNNNPAFGGRGNPKQGDDYAAAPNIDHSQGQVICCREGRADLVFRKTQRAFACSDWISVSVFLPKSPGALEKHHVATDTHCPPANLT
eukprot:1147814-Pelagomonas_calceolata.AAC.1